MKKIVVIPNVNKDKDLVLTGEVVDRLLSLGFDVFMAEETLSDKDVSVSSDKIPEGVDLAVIVGGDGSVIDASRISVERDIPILGINLGRLGYMTEVEIDSLSALDNLKSGNYSIIEKMLLSVEFCNGRTVCERYAVNDVTISRDSSLHIADIRVEDSLENAVKLRADGVVLSTPQGSTAYSFSAGGPIVAHDVESILMTPISPHSFFNRSVLFNSSDTIKLTNQGEMTLKVSVDGRCVGNLDIGDSCMVRKAPKTVKMLTFTKNSMFTSLFKKMRILGDIG